MVNSLSLFHFSIPERIQSYKWSLTLLFGMWSGNHLEQSQCIMVLSFRCSLIIISVATGHVSVKHGAVVRGLKYMITSFKTDAVLGKQVNRQQLMKFFPVRCIPRINNVSILVTFVSHINRIIELFLHPRWRIIHF